MSDLGKYGFDRVAEIHALAAPGANTDIISDYTPDHPGIFRIEVQLATASIFNLMASDGATEYGSPFNIQSDAEVALAAGIPYNFTRAVKQGNTYNFQVETDGIIQILIVHFIPKGFI